MILPGDATAERLTSKECADFVRSVCEAVPTLKIDAAESDAATFATEALAEARLVARQGEYDVLCHAPRFFEWLDSRQLCFENSAPPMFDQCEESANRTLDGQSLLRAFLAAPHEEDFNGRTVAETIRWTKDDLGIDQVRRFSLLLCYFAYDIFCLQNNRTRP